MDGDQSANSLQWGGLVDLEAAKPVLDRATRLARTLFQAPLAYVTLISGDSAWRTSDGPIAESRSLAARQVVERGAAMWVEDMSADPLLHDAPAVTGHHGVRFFAGAPIRLDDGSVPGAVWVADHRTRAFDPELASGLQDLADFAAHEWSRVRAEAAGRAAERQRDAWKETVLGLIRSTPVPMMLLDRELRIRAASPRLQERWGATGATIEGRYVGDFAHAQIERFRPILERCLTGEQVKVGRTLTSDLDGAPSWADVDITPWRDASGEIAGLIVVTYDVTELVSALEHSARSEERLKLAMDIAQIHVWEKDYVEQTLTKVGPELSFYSEPKVYDDIGDSLAAVDPRDRDEVRIAWKRHLQTGAPFRPEYRVCRSDGREVWTVCAAQVTTDETGYPRRLVGAMQNITERKLAERALRQAKEEAEAATIAKSAFLATMSHEIRTPLNGVLGMTQAMAADELTDQQRERLNVIRYSGESLLAILNDFLDLSKIEAGKLELEETPFDIGEIARNATAAFAVDAARKGIDFELTVAPAAGGAYLGDPGRVRQVLHNLVSNALKFTDSGRVAVQVDRLANRLVLAVEDTGIGLSAEQVSRIFQKFEQADASITRRFGGSGLGLAICSELAELMGGSISVQSEPGRGARFSVVLPLRRVSRKALAAAEPAPRDDVQAWPARVLAAEDNAVNQLVLKTLLAQVGLQPVIVSDGREAVAAWEREPWDLILMDVQMPVMDGLAATALIRSQEQATGRTRTPIVALTANAMSHQVAEYAECGMDGFVSKPIDAGQLFAAIMAAIEQPEPAAGDAEAAA